MTRSPRRQALRAFALTLHPVARDARGQTMIGLLLTLIILGIMAGTIAYSVGGLTSSTLGLPGAATPASGTSGSASSPGASVSSSVPNNLISEARAAVKAYNAGVSQVQHEASCASAGTTHHESIAAASRKRRSRGAHSC